MQKGTESFSEIEDGLLDALPQERTAIQEIEREKEKNSFIEKIATVPTSKKKLWYRYRVKTSTMCIRAEKKARRRICGWKMMK